MRLAFLFLVLATLAAGTVIAAPAPGGGVSVMPVRLDLAPQRLSGSVQVQNGADRERRFQVEVLRWSHVDGEERYEPAPEMVANPPLFRVAAGGTQVLRVGRSGAPPTDLQAAYRLYVTEIPDANAPPGNELRMLMRFGVPVFVAPQAAVVEKLTWSARHTGKGLLQLAAVNEGNVQQRRARIVVSDADSSRTLWSQEGFVDLLAGGDRHQWPVKYAGPAPRRLRITALSDSGPVDAVVPVTP